MAERPVFLTLSVPPYVQVIDTEFEFFSGFSITQKQRSIASLQQAFLDKYPEKEVLEISTKSPQALGSQLSAFHLTVNYGNDRFAVENAFQSSKRFTAGGPFKDLLHATPKQAKRDPRLRTSGRLVEFSFFGKTFPLKPLTFFYDWLYVTALRSNPDLVDALVDYTAFTDIEFNPTKSINCQARSVALFQGMRTAGVLAGALSSSERFRELAYTREEADGGKLDGTGKGMQGKLFE